MTRHIIEPSWLRMANTSMRINNLHNKYSIEIIFKLVHTILRYLYYKTVLANYSFKFKIVKT